MSKNKVPLQIKYEGQATNGGVDFAVLGESFIGFDRLIKELFQISGINGSLEIRTEKVEPGSVISQLQLYITTNGLPFNDAKHLYDFLQVAAPELLPRAKSVVSEARTVMDGLNAFYRDRPFEAMMVTNFISYLMGKHSGKKLRTDDRLPDRIHNKLLGMYRTGKFKKALSPLKENGYEKITISPQHPSDRSLDTSIKDSDLDSYLPEEEQVLPFFKDGDIISFNAKVVGLSSTRGEVVTLKINEFEKSIALYHAFPPEKLEASAYKDFFGQNVSVVAQVVRKNNNLFKRPEFNIVSMDTAQTVLDFE